VVAADELPGHRVIDARGKIVAPGFIDILSGGIGLEGNRYKAMDGVTTLLAMHGGPLEVADWYEEQAAEGRVVNYGTTVGHAALREAVGVDDRDLAASSEQVGAMARLARQGIREGAVGIGFGVQYVPGAAEEEIFELFRVCAETVVPCHLHSRFLGPEPPENDIKGIQEVIANAAATGASAQIVHLPAMAGHSLRSMELALKLIEGAQRNGVDVWADAYPWDAGSTSLESAVFDPGWEERMRISYGDLELVSNGERLTRETFEAYRADGRPTPVIIYHVREEGTRLAYASPFVMVGSDGGINRGRGHPRGAGTYARFLRQFVREGEMPLMEALRKMTYLPAQRVVKAAPVMRRKGRLSAGADADLVIFDLDRVRERATYAEPAQYSEGFDFVLVNGVVVVDAGRLDEEARPGRPVRGAP
jgi:N-acyl-D-aspartate/D-glutamate deacylase